MNNKIFGIFGIFISFLLWTLSIYYTGKMNAKTEYNNKKMGYYIKAVDTSRKEESIYNKQIESIIIIYKEKKEQIDNHINNLSKENQCYIGRDGCYIESSLWEKIKNVE